MTRCVALQEGSGHPQGMLLNPCGGPHRARGLGIVLRTAVLTPMTTAFVIEKLYEGRLEEPHAAGMGG